jgi:hypothetical protein
VRKLQTNGMVERINRRIAEVMSSMSRDFKDRDVICKFVLRFAENYNRTHLRTLNYVTLYK